MKTMPKKLKTPLIAIALAGSIAVPAAGIVNYADAADSTVAPDMVADTASTTGQTPVNDIDVLANDYINNAGAMWQNVQFKDASNNLVNSLTTDAGTFKVNDDFTVTFTPKCYNGPAQVTYVGTDSDGASAETTLTVDVSGNDNCTTPTPTTDPTTPTSTSSDPTTPTSTSSDPTTPTSTSSDPTTPTSTSSDPTTATSTSSDPTTATSTSVSGSVTPTLGPPVSASTSPSAATSTSNSITPTSVQSTSSSTNNTTHNGSNVGPVVQTDYVK